MVEFFSKKEKPRPSLDRIPRSLSGTNLGSYNHISLSYGTTPPLLTQSLSGTQERIVQRSLSSGTESSGVLRAHAQGYPLTSSEYELISICGQGATAKVYRALCKPLQEVVAVKQVDLEIAGDNLDTIIQEAQLMSQLRHPNILPMLACFVEDIYLYMVMPYILGGSVESAMNYGFSKGLEERVVAPIMLSVLHAIDYLHKNSILHRDVKASNILLNHDVVVLGDFGIATRLERNLECPDSKGQIHFGSYLMRKSYVGTPIWMAPEVIAPDVPASSSCNLDSESSTPKAVEACGIWDSAFWIPTSPPAKTPSSSCLQRRQNIGHDMKADIYAFGISILEMAMGKPPYTGMPYHGLCMGKLHDPPPELPSHHEKKHFSSDMHEVVALCLRTHPEDRPTAAELLGHRFFKWIKHPRNAAAELLVGVPGPVRRLDSLNRRHQESVRLGLENPDAGHIGDERYSVNHVRSKDAAHAMQTFGAKEAIQVLQNMMSSKGVHKLDAKVSGASAEGFSPKSYNSTLAATPATPSSRRLSFTKSKSFAKGELWPHLPPTAFDHAKAVLFASGGRKGFGVQTSWGNGFLITNLGSAESPCWTGPIYVYLTGSKSVGIGENSRETVVLFKNRRFNEQLLKEEKMKFGDVKVADAVGENLRMEDIMAILKDDDSKWNGVAFRHYANSKTWSASSSAVIVDSLANEKLYGKAVDPKLIMQGKEAPPVVFRGLIELLISAQQGRFEKISMTKSEHDYSDNSLSAHSSGGHDIARNSQKSNPKTSDELADSAIAEGRATGRDPSHKSGKDFSSPFVPRSSFIAPGSPPDLESASTSLAQTPGPFSSSSGDVSTSKPFSPLPRVHSEPLLPQLPEGLWEMEIGTPPPYADMAQSYFASLSSDSVPSPSLLIEQARLVDVDPSVALANLVRQSSFDPASIQASQPQPIRLGPRHIRSTEQATATPPTPTSASECDVPNPFSDANSSPSALDSNTPQTSRSSGLGRPPKPGKPPRSTSAKSTESLPSVKQGP